MRCRHVEIQEDEEVEEFQLIEKLQQLGINQGMRKHYLSLSVPHLVICPILSASTRGEAQVI